MSIVLIGMKGCGKSTLGAALAEKLRIPFLDVDAESEKIHQRERGEALTFRQIFKEYGAIYFQALETRTLQHIAQAYAESSLVLACGGRTPLPKENQQILARLGTIVYLYVEKQTLLKRILAQGVPAFFPYPDDPERSLDALLAERAPIYKKIAQLTINTGAGTVEEIVATMLTELKAYDHH